MQITVCHCVTSQLALNACFLPLFPCFIAALAFMLCGLMTRLQNVLLKLLFLQVEIHAAGADSTDKALTT